MSLPYSGALMVTSTEYKLRGGAEGLTRTATSRSLDNRVYALARSIFEVTPSFAFHFFHQMAVYV